MVLSNPAFILIDIGSIPATLTGLALVAFPVTFYVANLASALPALFPTAHRYGAMGIAYNFARRHLPGSMPSVDSEKAARELVATQGDNPMLDMDTLPFGTSYEAAKAAHAGPESRAGER